MRRRALASWLGWGLLAGCGGAPAPVSVFSEKDARLVLEPRSFGWLSSEREAGALPSAIPVGAKTSGRIVLHLEFPEVTESRRLLHGQLLLTPAQVRGETVEVEVSRPAATGPELRRWSYRSRALYPRVSAQLSAQGFPIRLDVTELLGTATARGEPLRLVLSAEPGEGEGVLIATGAAGGQVPRLELYFQ